MMKIDKVVCHKCGAVIPAPWVATSYHELEAKFAISEARVEELTARLLPSISPPPGALVASGRFGYHMNVRSYVQGLERACRT